MEKWICITLISGMLIGCSAIQSESPEESAQTGVNTANPSERDILGEDAAKILEEYLDSQGIWESDYVLEALDASEKIEGESVFRFEMRYADNVQEVGDRLIDNYAVTSDGERIFHYNAADDEWVQCGDEIMPLADDLTMETVLKLFDDNALGEMDYAAYDNGEREELTDALNDISIFKYRTRARNIK